MAEDDDKGDEGGVKDRPVWPTVNKLIIHIRETDFSAVGAINTYQWIYEAATHRFDPMSFMHSSCVCIASLAVSIHSLVNVEGPGWNPGPPPPCDTAAAGMARYTSVKLLKNDTWSLFMTILVTVTFRASAPSRPACECLFISPVLSMDACSAIIFNLPANICAASMRWLTGCASDVGLYSFS